MIVLGLKWEVKWHWRRLEGRVRKRLNFLQRIDKQHEKAQDDRLWSKKEWVF